MSHDLTIVSDGKLVHLWGFAVVHRAPDCVMCVKCGAEYCVDAICAMCKQSARAYGAAELNITCCAAPPDYCVVVFRLASPNGYNRAASEQPASTPQSDEPDAEPAREPEPAVCRWCKGTGKITVNFKTKPCEECAGKDGTVGQEDVGVGWKVKHEYRGLW